MKIPKAVILECIERRKKEICTLRFVRGELTRTINAMIYRAQEQIRFEKTKLK